MGDKAGAWLYRRLRADQWTKKSEKTEEYLQQIFPREDKEKRREQFWSQKIILFLAAALAGIFLFLYCLLAEPAESLLKRGNQVQRQEGDTSLEMTVTAENEAGKWQKDMTFPLKQRKFTKEEKAELEKTVRQSLTEILPGNNGSLEQVTRPLRMPDRILDGEVELAWYVDEQYLEKDGSLRAEGIPGEGADTEVAVEASCRNWSHSYIFSVHLEPPQYTDRQVAFSQVRQSVREALREQGTSGTVELPRQAGDIRITYDTESEKSYAPVFLALGAILLMPLLWREKQKKKMEEREQQLFLDYPGMINRFMLLLGAGLTVRRAVERLAAEYEALRGEGGNLRYAYEELCIMNQEMRDGLSEGQALERFGRRCRIFPYLKFASVVSQNLKKGSEGLMEILEKESLEALEEKKQRVLQMGEQAGTRLLLPMMLLLVLVMGIIMVPAFMTM